MDGCPTIRTECQPITSGDMAELAFSDATERSRHYGMSRDYAAMLGTPLFGAKEQSGLFEKMQHAP
jgi:hypothetical protein